MQQNSTTIYVSNPMQDGYVYDLSAPEGQDFDPLFDPYFTPAEMLSMGVFEGCYLNSAAGEYPKHWFTEAKLAEKPDIGLNFFQIKSRQPLGEWQRKGWIYDHDPRGWFEWYCRYYLGRRVPGMDDIQIKRWRAFVRHAGQIKANCMSGDLSCRPRQRQALLQWAHDPFI